VTRFDRVIRALFLTATLAQASELGLSVVLEKDTFLPYEPVMGSVAVTNRSRHSVSIPDIGLYGTSAFEVAVVTDAGVVLRPVLAFPMEVPGEPTWQQHVLGPGEILSTPPCDIASGAGNLPWHDIFAALAPGQYSVKLKWDRRMATWSLDWTFDTSNVVSFTVREPDSSEQPAFLLYDSLARYMDSLSMREARFRVSDRLARRIIRRNPDGLYAALARYALWFGYAERRSYAGTWLRPKPAELRAWSDSLKSIECGIITSFPDSPVAELHLRRRPPRSKLDNLALLHDLLNKFPDSRVGREAARQLKQLDDYRGNR